ncbi:hypothetical protein [[Clostridium] aminophilum]|nr:hypothetical protein [[Clostridium] aminophilum]
MTTLGKGNGMNSYFLMDKNRPLVKFEIKENPLGDEVRVLNIETASEADTPAIPLLREAIRNQDIDTWMTAWLEGRNFAKHKDHMKRWLKEWGIDKTKGFIDLTHALSLNDALWVKDTSSDLTWEKANYYSNPFSDVAETTGFDSNLENVEFSPTSPEVTAEGTSPKCWRRLDDGIYLYKTGLKGAANVGLEPYSEYISSYILRQMAKQEVLPYELERFKDNLCSVCGLFTSEKEGYMPFYRYLAGTKTNYTIKDVIQFCDKLGFAEEVREMFLTDSIVMNQDRHLGNFGFIVDNDTFEIKRFAPLYDYNSSLLCNAMEEDLRDFEKYENEFCLGHKLGGVFSEVGKALCTDAFINRIPKEIILPRHVKYNLPEFRLKAIAQILTENLRKITGKEYFSFRLAENGETIRTA